MIFLTPIEAVVAVVAVVAVAAVAVAAILVVVRNKKGYYAANVAAGRCSRGWMSLPFIPCFSAASVTAGVTLRVCPSLRHSRKEKQWT